MWMGRCVLHSVEDVIFQISADLCFMTILECLHAACESVCVWGCVVVCMLVFVYVCVCWCVRV